MMLLAVQANKLYADILSDPTLLREKGSLLLCPVPLSKERILAFDKGLDCLHSHRPAKPHNRLGMRFRL